MTIDNPDLHQADSFTAIKFSNKGVRMKYNLHVVNTSICRSALCMVVLFLAFLHSTGAFAEDKFAGLRYLSVKGPNETKLFSGIPPSINMAISGNDLDKNNVSYSVLNALAISGGSYIKYSEEVSEKFIVLIFSDSAISEAGVNLKELKGFENDPPMVAALQDSFKPGMSCVSAAVFSDRGTFLRSLILSNNDIANEELAQCSLEAGAHVFGISTADASYRRVEYPEQIARFSKMIHLKKQCADRGNITVSCADSALEDIQNDKR